MENNNTHKYPFYDPELPLEERIDDLLSRLTVSEKIKFIPSRQPAISRLGIKEYSIGGEAAHGLVFRDGPPTTVFPQTIGLSSTWDRELLRKAGNIVGQEARAYYEKNDHRSGITLWAPTVDPGRDPRWGRTEEIFGEDPYLTGELATEYIKGMQGEHEFYIKAAAALKHFYANNNETDRQSCSVSIDERNKREYYFEAFRKPVEEGRVACMMTAYNEVNGVPCNLNREVKEVVKKEWGLPGFVVSDGGDFRQTVTCHQYFDSYARTAAGTLKSGVDCIPAHPDVGKHSLIIEAFEEAYEKGLLTENDLDQALRNIFRIRFRLGQFDPEERNPYSGVSSDVICSKEHSRIALEAARKSIVLLKNENNILPLNKKALDEVAVIGPLGDKVYRDWYTGTASYQISPLEGIKNKLGAGKVSFVDGRDRVVFKSRVNNKYLGIEKETDNLAAIYDTPCEETIFYLNDWGWGKYTLQSEYNGKYVTEKEGLLTVQADRVWGWFVREMLLFNHKSDGSIILQNWEQKPFAFSEGEKHIMFSDKLKSEIPGLTMEVLETGSGKAAATARGAEAAVVFVGNHPLINGREDYDRPDLVLPPAQKELLQEVKAANPNTVLAIVGSYPYSINWAQENISGILYSSHGGQELGTAVSDVLFGEYNPAGKLSMTWYKGQEQLPDIKEYDIIQGQRTYMYFEEEPLYPFGHGETYTSFRYSGLRLNKEILIEGDILEIELVLKNIGHKESDEVVQLYVKSLNNNKKRPLKQLKDFKRVHLTPGEEKKIKFTLTADDFSFWDKTENKFTIENESFKIMIGSSSADIRLEREIAVCKQTVNKTSQKKKAVYRLKASDFDGYQDMKLVAGEEQEACVQFEKNGGWLRFCDIRIPAETSKIKMKIAGGLLQDVNLKIRLDSSTGAVIADYKKPVSKSKSSREKGQIVVVDLKELAVNRDFGRRDLYITGAPGNKINWLQFI